MFTGIIEEVGTVERLDQRATGARLRIRSHKVVEDTPSGASINVNGVCLTAVDISASGFAADVSPETLERSNLGKVKTGTVVNLERALSPAGRLGGHIVQGHVDGTGEYTALEFLGDGNWWLSVRLPAEVERYCVFKGSLAIDGISLTIARLEGGVASATIVPHTYQNTALRSRRPGDIANLEVDILAKYVEKLLTARSPDAPPPQPARHSKITEAKLRELGY